MNNLLNKILNDCRKYTKDGNVAYYSKLMFSFERFEITCRPFKGDISQVDANFILNRDDVPEMKINAKKH